jgi:hypothetical protein
MDKGNDNLEIYANGGSATAADQPPAAASPIKSMADAAMRYHAAGLRITTWKPDPEPKNQFSPWKQYRTSQSVEQVRAITKKPFERLAILTGVDDVEAIDIDVKHDPKKTIDKEFSDKCREYETPAAALAKCVIVRTKSGGLHIIYRAENVEGNQKLAHREEEKEAVIETRGIGGLIYAAPSPGYTLVQGDYCNIQKISNDERNALISVARLLSHRSEVVATGEKPGEAYNAAHTVLELANEYGWSEVSRDGDTIYLNRPGAKNPKGVDASILTSKTGEQLFYPFSTSTAFDAEKCYSPFAMFAVQKHRGNFVEAARELRKLGYGKPPKQQKPNNVDPGSTEKGQEVIKSAYTEMVGYIQKHHDFRLDEVGNELETKIKSAKAWQVLNENNLLHELRAAGHKISDTVLMSLLGSDFVPKFDPFLTYFKALPAHDPAKGSPIDRMAAFVTLKDEERDRDWFNRMYRKMLVRVAAAATCRIQFNKQCFVLKSDQNDGKSTWIRHHCPPALAKYRADWTRDEVSDKDGRFALAQNFMINLDELATFGKSNIEQTKALMSLDSIKDRPPYGKRPIRFPRRASFFGSTNKDEFLTDESGSVRWLVFEIAGIQHDNGGPNGYGEKVDINDVWAEAWYLLNQGEIEPMMSREDVVKSEARNKVFQVPTPEMELVGQHLKKTNSEEEKAEFLTVTEITNHLAGLTFLKLNKNFVGAALKHMGWEKVARFDKAKNFQVIGYWVKKETTQQSDFVENDENPKE